MAGSSSSTRMCPRGIVGRFVARYARERRPTVMQSARNLAWSLSPLLSLLLLLPACAMGCGPGVIVGSTGDGGSGTTSTIHNGGAGGEMSTGTTSETTTGTDTGTGGGCETTCSADLKEVITCDGRVL